MSLDQLDWIDSQEGDRRVRERLDEKRAVYLRKLEHVRTDRFSNKCLGGFLTGAGLAGLVVDRYLVNVDYQHFQPTGDDLFTKGVLMLPIIAGFWLWHKADQWYRRDNEANWRATR